MNDAVAATARGKLRLSWLMVMAMVACWLGALMIGVDAVRPAPDDLVAVGGNLAARTRDGQWWRLVTAALVHAGALHLVINAIVLLALGTMLETRIGRAAIVAVLLGATVAASAASLAWSPYTASVGASGAIAGVVGALLVALVRARDTFTPRGRVATAIAVALVLGWGVAQVALFEGVDHAAHAAGLAAGVAIGVLVAPRAPAWRAALGLAGAVAAAVIVIASSPPPIEIEARARRLIAIDTRFDAIVRGAGLRPDGPRLARTLEAEILAPFRADTIALVVDDRLPSAERARARALRDWAHARLRALELFVRYLDTGDPALAAEITAADAAATAALESLGGTSPQPP